MPLLVGLVILPISLVAMSAISIEVQQFFDPCVQWGVQAHGVFAARLEPDAPCRSITTTSEIKRSAAIRTVLVPGCIVIAAALALIGASTSRPGFLFVAAIIIFLEAFPLVFSFAPLALLTAGGLILLRRRLIHVSGEPTLQG